MPLFGKSKTPKQSGASGTKNTLNTPSDHRNEGNTKKKENTSSSSSDESETEEYDTATYENLYQEDMDRFLHALHSTELSVIKKFWKKVNPDIRKALLKSDVDMLSISEEERLKEASRDLDYLSDVENIVDAEIHVLTTSNLDAGEQYNAIGDRLDLADKKLQKLEEKKQLKTAQRLLEKDPLNPKTAKKVKNVLNANECHGDTEMRDVVREIIQEELRDIKALLCKPEANKQPSKPSEDLISFDSPCPGNPGSSPDSSSSSSSSSSDTEKRSSNKKKDKEKRKRKKRREKKKKEKERADSGDSVMSQTSSVFERDPIRFLIFKLSKCYKLGLKILNEHKTEAKVLEMSERQLSDNIKYFYDTSSKLPNPSPQNEELITSLITDIEDLQFKTVLEIDKINKTLENRKYGPKQSYPQFNSDPLGFHTFQHQMDILLQYLTDEEKVINYKKNLVGPKKEELLSYLSNITDYDTLKKAMQNKFGDVNQLLPSQIEILRNLPKTPHDEAKENENISKIIAFIRWIQAHDRMDVFNDAMIIDAATKLRSYNQERWKWDLQNSNGSKLQNFMTFIETIQSHNFGKLTYDNQQGNKHSRSKETTPIGTGVKAAGVKPPKTGPTCGICSGGHWTNKCNSLTHINSPSEMKNFLLSKNICLYCVVPNTIDHKKECTSMYPHKRTNIPISKLCQCSSGLSKTICPCRRAYGSRPATARVPMPGTSSALAAAPPPFPPPAPAPIPVPSTAPFPAVVPPTTASRSANNISVTALRCYKIMVNNTVLGSSQCTTQLIDMVNKNGQTAKVMVLWDGGSDNTLISNTLKDFFLDSEPVQYQLQQCTNTTIVNGDRVGFCLLHNNKPLYLQALSTTLDDQYVDTKMVSVPEQWQKDFQMAPTHFTPAGCHKLIIGRDLNEIQPVEIGRLGKLSLYRSCINDQLIISGSNITSSLSGVIKVNRAGIGFKPKLWDSIDEFKNEYNDKTTTKASNESKSEHVSEHIKAHKANIGSDDAPCGQDIAVLSKACPDCRDHDCSKCKEQIMKSPQTIFEEEGWTIENIGVIGTHLWTYPQPILGKHGKVIGIKEIYFTSLS